MNRDIMNDKNPEVQAIQIIPDPSGRFIQNYFRVMTSFSHLLGCITSVLVGYIGSAFNKNYFRTIWNSMEVMYSQRSKSFLDAISKPRPILIIDPHFDPSEEPDFRPQSEFDEYVSNSPYQYLQVGMSERDAHTILEFQNFKLYCRPRQYRMTFNLHFLFDSDMERIKCQEYMRQSIRHRYINPINRYVEHIIPDEYMKEIARINGFDYRDKNFLKFINNFSSNPITRRLRGSSGNIEFFWMVRSPIQIKFGDSAVSDGPFKKGNIEINSSFSEVVTVDFVGPSLYYLITRMHPGDPLYKKTITASDAKQDTNMTAVGETFYLGWYPSIPSIDKNGDIKLFTLTVQADNNEDETINLFRSVQNAEIYAIHTYYKKHKLKNNFMSVNVLEDGEDITKDRSIFNFNNFDLTIKDMNMYKTYYVTMYINKSSIGELYDKLYGTEEYNEVFGKDDSK